MQIYHYDDFISTLISNGFSMGGSNSEGIFSIISWDWKETPPYDTPVCWHTGIPETDPWAWRMRVLDERNDVAYSKLFFKKSGYLTKDWYPYFLAVRRGGMSFEEAYQNGTISHYGKRIYDALQNADALPVHIIKQLVEFSGNEKSKFERGLVELQMGLFITMCGQQQKITQKGKEYSWPSAAFCTTEHFWGDEVFHEAARISEKEAIERITEQVYALNPCADQKKILKFIKGK